MIRSLTIALLVCATLPACKKSGGDGQVTFLLSTLQEERYQKDRRYFEQRAAELGLSVRTLSADNDDAKQLAQVEDALARGAKVIVVQPTDSAAASAYVRMAHAQGARVIAYDRAILSKDLDYYVSHDSYQVGVLQARAAIEATGGKGNFVILSGQAGHSVAIEITRGYLDTLRPYLDRGDIKVVAREDHASWSPEQALRTVEDALVRAGKIDAVLANNSGMARGAVQALEAAGAQGVFVAGADADAANVNFVCQGKQSVEVLKDIQPLAATAADVAAELVAGRAPQGSTTIELGGGAVPVAAVRVALVTPETVKPLLVDSGFLAADELPGCKGKLAAAPRAAGGTRTP
jgi:D-xylose transport system substrate-binding protein